MTSVLVIAGLFLLLSVGFRLLIGTSGSDSNLQRLLGFSILGHALNLLLLISGLTPPNAESIGTPPFVQAGRFEWMVDPLPQALILTAIVIQFGFTAFLFVFFLKSKKTGGTL